MRDTERQNRHNQITFERDCEQYLNRTLLRPELELLRLYKDRWRETDMLDLGVGAGRTSQVFSILARTYLGIDYVPRMIDLCRFLIRETETVQFAVADAAELSAYADQRFDVVLFSFNGIDCVSHEKRLKILAEVRKLLNEGGHFLFSSHSLHAFPFSLRLPKRGGDSLIRWLYRCCRRLEWFPKQKYFNRHVRVHEAKQRGWELLADGDHNFGCRFYYVMPEYQIQQLKETGFEIVAVFNGEGKSIDWRTPTEDIWLHYLCSPRSN